MNEDIRYVSGWCNKGVHYWWDTVIVVLKSNNGGRKTERIGSFRYFILQLVFDDEKKKFHGIWTFPLSYRFQIKSLLIIKESCRQWVMIQHDVGEEMSKNVIIMSGFKNWNNAKGVKIL